MITARSTPNIAFIKFWGYPEGEIYAQRRLCAADSLSMTLDGPYVDVSIEQSDVFSVTSKTLGEEKEMNESNVARFKRQIDLAKEYVASLGAPNVLENEVSISIESHIPPSIGLASSAAVFSGVAKAFAELIKDQIELTDEQISVVARLGSGSAARSIFGGYGAITMNQESTEIDAGIGWQVADENHWTLHDIIIVPSTQEKKVGSSEGHPLASTSPHFAQRIHDIQTRRQPECIAAIQYKDFEKLTAIVEEDCMDMHENIMQQQDPPLNYLSDVTYRIIDDVKRLRDEQHLPVLYTMDAGPTVHLFCTDESRETVKEFANNQEDCKVYTAVTGSGTKIV